MSALAQRVACSMRQASVARSAVLGARHLSSAAAAEAASSPAAAPAASASSRGPFFSSQNKVSFSLPKQSAKQKAAAAAASSAANVSYALPTAVRLVQSLATASFDETVALSVRLNLDPRKPNQSVRGAAALPHGTGKQVRIAVFAKGEKAQEARAAGADLVGDKELVDQILGGTINFDRCIATPDMMAFVGRVARILGPRGLMPNPKVGTVTNDIGAAVKAGKQGSVEFKTDKTGVVAAPVGKVSFGADALADNISALVDKLVELKPSGAPKGAYIVSAHIASTQGKGVALDIKQAPFKGANAASGAASAAGADAASAIPFGRPARMHSVHGYKVVRYDLGAHPSAEAAARAKGKWPQVLQQLKQSKKAGHDWNTVLNKIDQINNADASTNDKQ